MANPTPSKQSGIPVYPPSLKAAFLSYLVPGLGQVYQGRIGKGLLFLFSIYGLFFLGMYLGVGTVLVEKTKLADETARTKYRTTCTRVTTENEQEIQAKLAERGKPGAPDKVYLLTVSNVYLPDTAGTNNPWGLRWKLAANLYNRPQFLAQFWVGIAAWPAIWQYATDGAWAETGSFSGAFMREPPEEAVNVLQTAGDKRWDLGWVYTVIAGVLNIMVIYDAYAGPAFGIGSERSRETEAKHANPSPAAGV